MPSAMQPDDSPEPATDSAPRARRAKLLDRLLEPDVDLDRAFDRLLDGRGLAARHGRDAQNPDADDRDDRDDQDGAEGEPMRSVVRGDALASDDITLAVLLTSVLSEYEDIERLLENLREHDGEPSPTREDAVAVVSEAELADPEALSRALAPLDSERKRFEMLFEMARAALERLDVYELSKMTSDDLVHHMRDERNLRTVQSAVGFLRSLHAAAESFEAMALPETHIRDYLTHLYRMGDWNEMARLVSVLELAVSQLYDAGDDAGTPQEAT